MSDYQPKAWFWIVGGDESRAWSSASLAYVSEWPPDRVTRIASEAELNDVLAPHGLVGPLVTEAHYAAAIQAHIDGTARARGYLDAVTCASYAVSTIEAWALEGAAFVAWRDQTWAAAYQTLAAVQNGQQAAPTIAELLAALPAINWPT